MANRKRRSTSQPKQSSHVWSVERLESRVMLAGDVSGVVRGTTLTLTGDSADNDIVLSGSAGAFSVSSGADATAIDVSGDLSRVRRLRINLGAGDDSLTMQNLQLSSTITLTGTAGQQIAIEDSNLSGLLRIDLNQSGTRDLNIIDSIFRRGIVVTSDGGALDTDISGTTSIQGRFSSRVVGDDSFLMQDDATIRGSLLRTTSRGDSSLRLQDQAQVTSLVRAKTTDGASNVEIVEDAEVGRYLGSGVNARRNVTYATRGSTALRADVYTPKSEGPHPAILTIHGGGWRIGSKAAMTRRARTLADRGYVVVNVNYRLAPANQFPAQIHDIKSAITWMRQNAASLQIDPDRIGTYGYSAGGHLALLAATADSSAGLEGPDADAGISTRVQAVVAGGPGVDFRDFAANEDRLSYFLGGTISELPQTYQDVSPANWLSADDPPTMIFIGENEEIVSRPKVDQYISDLDSLGITHRLHEVPGKGHLATIGDSRALLESAKFMDEILKA